MATGKAILYKVGEKGSSKSGNFNHAGRPGKLGGSTVKGGSNGAVNLANLSVPQIDVSKYTDRYQATLATSINQINRKAAELGLSAQGDVGLFEERARVYFTPDQAKAINFSQFVNGQTVHKTTSNKPVKRVTPDGKVDYAVKVRQDVAKTKAVAYQQPKA